jgi:hypothetical protein
MWFSSVTFLLFAFLRTDIMESTCVEDYHRHMDHKPTPDDANGDNVDQKDFAATDSDTSKGQANSTVLSREEGAAVVTSIQNSGNDDNANHQMQLARRRNAMYSKHKYYRKKRFIESLRSTRVQLLENNHKLRSSNEQLEEIIQRSQGIIALKKMVQSERTQRELLKLLQPTLPPLPPHRALLPSRSNLGAHTTPPSRFGPCITTNYANLPSNTLYHSHKNTSVSGANILPSAPTNMRGDLPAMGALHDNGLGNGSLYHEYLMAVATMNTSQSLEVLTTGSSVGESSSLSSLFPSVSVQSPLLSSQMFQQELRKPTFTFDPPNESLLRHDVLDRRNSHSGISHSNLFLQNTDIRNEVAPLHPATTTAATFEHHFPPSPPLMHTTGTESTSSQLLQHFLLRQL